MSSSAFILDRQFINDLWERINTLDTNFTPIEILDSVTTRGVVPSKEHLANLLDYVYWTSYEKEEGSNVLVSVIFRKPEHGPDSFCFDKPIRLSTKSLTKLGPALENPKAHITIWPDEDDQLKIWGFRTITDDIITNDLSIQGLGPGRILIAFDGKSLAALTSTRSIFIDPSILMKALMPKISADTTPDNSEMQAILRYNSILFIAQSMRAHGHGGTVLVVPEGSDWKSSIRQPSAYTGGASFLDIDLKELQQPAQDPLSRKSFFDFVRKTLSRRQERSDLTREKIRQQCSRIARLTAVDGALVMSLDRYTYCFGAKIEAISPAPSAFELQLQKPIEGYVKTSINFSDLGGTRHLSAAQFAYDRPEAISFVASQDGDVTFFTREPKSGGLLAIQQAELALLHEGLSSALWNISLFSNMDNQGIE